MRGKNRFLSRHCAQLDRETWDEQSFGLHDIKVENFCQCAFENFYKRAIFSVYRLATVDCFDSARCAATADDPVSPHNRHYCRVMQAFACSIARPSTWRCIVAVLSDRMKTDSRRRASAFRETDRNGKGIEAGAAQRPGSQPAAPTIGGSTSVTHRGVIASNA